MVIKIDYKNLITTVIAVVGLYLGWVQASQEFFGKSLTLEKIATIELGSKMVHPIRDVKLMVAESEVENPHINLFYLNNDGAKPVTPEDFVSEIEIGVEEGTKIISAAVYDDSKALMSLSIVANKIRLSKSLLNPKDSVAFKVLTSGNAPIFTTQARIVGIKAIRMVDEKLDRIPTRSPANKIIDVLVLGSLIFLSVRLTLSTRMPTRFSIMVMCALSCLSAYTIVMSFPYFTTTNHRFEKIILTILLTVIPVILAYIYVKTVEKNDSNSVSPEIKSN